MGIVLAQSSQSYTEGKFIFRGLKAREKVTAQKVWVKNRSHRHGRGLSHSPGHGLESLMPMV
jgi:hypothetical protein